MWSSSPRNMAVRVTEKPEKNWSPLRKEKGEELWWTDNQHIGYIIYFHAFSYFSVPWFYLSYTRNNTNSCLHEGMNMEEFLIPYKWSCNYCCCAAIVAEIYSPKYAVLWVAGWRNRDCVSLVPANLYFIHSFPPPRTHSFPPSCCPK